MLVRSKQQSGGDVQTGIWVAVRLVLRLADDTETDVPLSTTGARSFYDPRVIKLGTTFPVSVRKSPPTLGQFYMYVQQNE